MIMGASAAERIHTSNDSASDADDELDRPSSGRAESRWIFAPIAQTNVCAIKPGPLTRSGSFVAPSAPPDSGTVQSEIAKLRLAAAASFFAFEDSLPDNEE
jgi:hypothetical protein